MTTHITEVNDFIIIIILTLFIIVLSLPVPSYSTTVPNITYSITHCSPLPYNFF
jgi:hypothetical protein